MPSLLAILGLDARQFESELKKAPGTAQQAGTQIGSALTNKIGGAIAGIGIAAALKKELDAAAELADKAAGIRAGSQRLNVDTDRFQQLDYAALKGRTSIDALFTAYKKLAVNTQEAISGNKEMVQQFAALGVSINDLQTKGPDELFAEISQNMQGAAFNGEQLTAIIKTLGKSADELIPALKEGLFNQSNPLAISPEEIKTLKEYKADLGVIGLAWKGIKEQIHLANAETLSGLAHPIAEFIRKQFGIKKGAEGSGEVDIASQAQAEANAQKQADDEAASAAKKKQQDAEKLIALQARYMKQETDNYLNSLSKEERLRVLKEKRAYLEKENKGFDLDTDEGQLKHAANQVEISELSGQIQALEKQKTSVRSLGVSLTENQRAGAYASITPAQQQMISLVTGIKTATDKLVQARTTGLPQQRGPQY